MIVPLTSLFALLSAAPSAEAARASSVLSQVNWAGNVGRLLGEAVDPNLCDPSSKSTSGYFEIDPSSAQPTRNAISPTEYFYWHFESRSSPSTDPLVLWLTGGPGCSSMLALLAENGPCSAAAGGGSTTPNPFSWTSHANVVWVDQPAGVGYSTGPLATAAENEAQVGDDLFQFLQAFFAAYPQYLEVPFFIFGESYGGHFAPAIGYRVLQANLAGEGVPLPLAGVGVGNGMTSPPIQFQYYPAMANNNTYGIKTVSEEAYSKMVQHMPSCQAAAEKCQVDLAACETAYTLCNSFETTPYYQTGLNPYDVRLPCEGSLCYDFSDVDTWMNLDSTRQALHVSPEAKEWVECDNAVNYRFVSDWMRRFDVPNVQALLDNDVRVLIYAGDADFICNWMGNQAWTLALDWTGQKEFNAAAVAPWFVEGAQAGDVRSANGFTFLRVFGAGHMAPMDQPQAALSLLDTFTAGTSFCG